MFWGETMPFDYVHFRAEFQRLKAETSYARANRLAEERKAAAWKGYTRLALNKLEDDWTQGEVNRPTEVLAIRRARRVRVLDADFPPLLFVQPPAESLRYCVTCKCKRPTKQFVRNRRTIDGIGYTCSVCREDAVRRNRRVS